MTTMADIISWEGVPCLVTGGVGFFGAHLSVRLAELGAKVTVLDKEEPHPKTYLWHRTHLPGGPSLDSMQVVTMDAASPAAQDFVRKIAPAYVFHLAGCPYGPTTTARPQLAEHDNVDTTVSMLAALGDAKTGHFMLASSACIFGAAPHSPLVENGPTSSPTHFYTLTKRRAEKAVREAQSNGVSAAISRFGNIYGPGDRHFGRVVPSLCVQGLRRTTHELELRRSRGDSVFEFLHVQDAVSGILAAARCADRNVDVFQFSGGPTSRSTPRDIAEKVGSLCGRTMAIKVNSETPEPKVEKYLDTRRTESALGWKPSWTLDQGLRTTLAWYSENLEAIAPHQE